MAILGTSVGGGQDFYARKAEQFANTLSMFQAARQDREQKREQEERDEIGRFFQSVQAMPELADTWGADVATKYGQKYPEVAAIIDAVQKRHEIKQEAPRALEAWYAQQQSLEDSHRARTAAFGQTPDAFQPPYGFPMPVPNLRKMQEAQELSQVNPAMFPAQALEQLPVRQRYLARIAAGDEPGLRDAIPSAFQPFEDLPLGVRGLEAERMMPGAVGAETLEILRSQGGLKRSAADVEKQGAEIAETKRKETVEDRQRREAHEEQEARIRLTDSLARGRSSQSYQQQRSIAEYQRGTKALGEGAEGKLSWKTLAEDNRAIVKDWEARLKAAQDEAGKAGEKPEARAVARTHFIRQNGPRPKVIPQVHLQAIAQRVNGEDLTPEGRAVVTDGVLTDYLAKIQAGKTPAQALAEVLAE